MFVYLIGAGPGDPGLITVKGASALAAADVVVYDYLASDELMALVRPDAEKIYVGKIAGDHAMHQYEINDLLIRKAKEGKTVARLKGGDPYIFGRGGEEGRALYDAGVPFMEIPGISSTIAGPAYAGIPVTDRTAASSVTIITGHEDPSKPGSVHNWQALAQSASTLVFVMGMKNLPDIVKNLMDAGLDPKTPAALVHWGTLPRQRSLDAPLSELHAAALREGFTNPSVIVVGKVVSLRSKLNWNETRPLFGKTIAVTRSREQASDMVRMLGSLGARTIQHPVIRIEPPSSYAELDNAIGSLSSYDWLVFTSVNGVKKFKERLDAAGRDARSLAGLKIAAIGPATAGELLSFGIRADCVPEKFIAESAAEAMLAAGAGGSRVLLVRAAEARSTLPDTLRANGASVDIVTAYVTVPHDPNKSEFLGLLEQGKLDCVTFASSSTVRNFLKGISPEVLKKHPETHIAAIGPVTARTLREYGLTADIMPEEYTIPALIAAITHAFSPETDMAGAAYSSWLNAEGSFHDS
ncbi:MAG: uroporphyrinogen-III C-methyltransferase [Mailhella sp.]|nr:uroporphyrinogen-III C-methyltransferase [Mailhella sp.]